MYTPKHFRFRDSKKVIDFIRRFNFGVMISVLDKKPVATHLPFVIEEKDDKLILTSHMAKNNEQWKNLEDLQVLTIFSEPHAYISPSHYDKKENVPTWNYLSVHAYGEVEIIHKDEEAFDLLESMMDAFEPEYKKQWEDLSEKYKKKMVDGIVAFRIEVKELQATEKLSQNKSAETRKKIADHLSKSESPNEQVLGEIMKDGKIGKK